LYRIANDDNFPVLFIDCPAGARHGVGQISFLPEHAEMSTAGSKIEPPASFHRRLVQRNRDVEKNNRRLFSPGRLSRSGLEAKNISTTLIAGGGIGCRSDAIALPAKKSPLDYPKNLRWNGGDLAILRSLARRCQGSWWMMRIL